jgi:putative ABC transport system permease protein
MKSYGDITYKYLKKQRKRTLLTIIGIILSVALITAVGTMFITLRKYEINKIKSETGDHHVRYMDVKGESVHKIKNSVYVSNTAVMRSEKDAVICKVSEKERSLGKNIPPYRYLKLSSWDEDAFKMFPISLKEGRLPKAPGELLLHSTVLEFLPGCPKLGDKITLDLGTRYIENSDTLADEFKCTSNEVFRKSEEKEFTIVGISNRSIEASFFYMANGITYLDSENLVKDKSHVVYVKMNTVKDVKEKGEEIAKTIGLQKEKDSSGNVKNPIKYNNKLLRMYAASEDSSMNKALIKISIFVVILIIICTVAVIYNAFNISVLERISQFGVLRCVGAAPKQIKNIVFKEATLLSIIGIPIGLILGVFATKVVIFLINSLVSNNGLVFFKDLEVSASLPILVGSAILGLITVYLSALGPARQAAKISPLEAVRNTGSFKKEKVKKVKKSKIIRTIFGFEGEFAFKNIKRNRKRFRITVFSIIISIVLYIVFTVLVNYIYDSGAIDGSVNADLGVSILKESKIQTFTEEQYKEMINLPGVEGIYTHMTSDITMDVPENRINKKFAQIKGDLLTNKKDDSILYSNAVITSNGEMELFEIKRVIKDNNLDLMNRENGVILCSNNYIYDTTRNKRVMVNVFDYKVGEEINIWVKSPDTESTEPQIKTVKIMGIIDKDLLNNSHNKNGFVELITTKEVYKNITDNNNYKDMAIKLKKDASSEAVVNYLKDFTSKNPNYSYIDISQMMDKIRGTLTTINIFLFGFVGVIVLIGCLNIINTITTNLILRKREFSVLKAMGMTENGIKKQVCMEGTLYGIISALYGGIIGSLLSYILFKLIEKNMIEIQWAIPWQAIITSTIGAVIVTLLASLIPLKRINEGSIVENIRIEE